MNALCTEETAFLAAICDDLEDDTRRLAYADWLDEHEASELKLCQQCNGKGEIFDGYDRWKYCKKCNGSDSTTPGFVCVSNGYADRAEFIRLDIALSRLEELPQYEYRFNPLEAERCRELVRKHPEWRPKCVLCAGEKGTTHCPGCSATGRIGTFQRGSLYSVTVPRLGDVLQQALEVDDDGREVWSPTPWARELVRDFPTVERVVFDDQQPTMEEGGWEWYGLPDVLNVPSTKGTYPNAFVARNVLAECVANVLKEMCQ